MPAGYHTVTPRMVVADVVGAVGFLRATFGASGDIPNGRPAESLEAPRDTPYGDRRAMVRDPYGNVFQIAHRREHCPRQS